MEAEPSGSGSIHRNTSFQGFENSASMASRTVSMGIGAASERSFASSRQTASGRMSERVERICPSFT